MMRLSHWPISAGPFVLAFVAPHVAGAAQGQIAAVSPRPDQHLATSPPSIVATVPPSPRGGIGKSSVRVVVDGRDVSDAITVAGVRVEYKPSPPLGSGEHAVEVSALDAAGGHLTYTWTFTVDGTPKAKPAAASAGSDPAPAPDVSGAQTPEEGSAQAPPSDVAPQTLFQQNYYGGFSPIGAGPYYWGDRAAFEFIGVPGGYGFLTFGGIPGVFDLLPLGFNTFYAIVPIPVGFIFLNPPVTCHFFSPNGNPTVAVLPSFRIVRHRRLVAAPARSSAPLRRAVALRQPVIRNTGGNAPRVRVQRSTGTGWRSSTPVFVHRATRFTLPSRPAHVVGRLH